MIRHCAALYRSWFLIKRCLRGSNKFLSTKKIVRFQLSIHRTAQPGVAEGPLRVRPVARQRVGNRASTPPCCALRANIIPPPALACELFYGALRPMPAYAVCVSIAANAGGLHLFVCFPRSLPHYDFLVEKSPFSRFCRVFMRNVQDKPGGKLFPAQP